MKHRFLLASLGMALLCVSNVRAQDTAQTDAKSLIGSWKLVSATYNGRTQELGKVIKIKHVTDSQFMWFVYEPGNKKVTDAAGGPYSVKGDLYSEKIVYGLGKDYEVVRGHEIPLHWKMEETTWRVSGRLNNGLMIEEVWEKIRIGQ